MVFQGKKRSGKQWKKGGEVGGVRSKKEGRLENGTLGHGAERDTRGRNGNHILVPSEPVQYADVYTEHHMSSMPYRLSLSRCYNFASQFQFSSSLCRDGCFRASPPCL